MVAREKLEGRAEALAVKVARAGREAVAQTKVLLVPGAGIHDHEGRSRRCGTLSFRHEHYRRPTCSKHCARSRTPSWGWTWSISAWSTTCAVEGDRVKVLYSLTSMGCPAGQMIEEGIRDAAMRIEGIEQVDAELTFTPPWTPDMMSDDAKFVLGF